MLRELLYRVYQSRLQSPLRAKTMPNHGGVLVCGVRPRSAVVTVWVLSTDNFKRDPEELENIYAIVEEKVGELAAAQARTKRRRRIRAVGRLELLPESTRAAIAKVEEDTAGNGPYDLLVAIGYGGRE